MPDHDRVRCPRCRRSASALALKKHEGGKNCRADELALSLLGRGLVPFSRAFDGVECEEHRTRAALKPPYVDADGGIVLGSRSLWPQFWGPAWVRAVAGAWAGYHWRAVDLQKVIRFGAARDVVRHADTILNVAVRELAAADEHVREALMTAAAHSDEAAVVFVLDFRSEL